MVPHGSPQSALSPNQETKRRKYFQMIFQMTSVLTKGSNLVQGMGKTWVSQLYEGQPDTGVSWSYLDWIKSTYCSSHPKTDNGILTFLLATSLCFESSFHLGVRLPRGSISLVLHYRGMSFGSFCSAPVVFKLHIFTSIHHQHIVCVKMNILRVSKKTEQEETRNLTDGKIHKMFSLKLLVIFCRKYCP